MFFDSKNILIVAAHPDDEVLGCGATLARARACGVEIHILIMGEGPTSRQDFTPEEQRRSAMRSALAAAEILGVSDTYFGCFPDNMFDTIPLLDLIRKIETVAEVIHPDWIFTHHHGDLNVDHQLTFRAVLTACRPLSGRTRVSVASFEVLSSTEYAAPRADSAFMPNLFVDVSDFLAVKQRAMTAYTSELRPWPHPRSHEGVECLARLRGCQCGCAAAEAFVIQRACC